MNDAELRLARIRDLRKSLEARGHWDILPLASGPLALPDTRRRECISDLRHCERLLETEAATIRLHAQQAQEVQR